MKYAKSLLLTQALWLLSSLLQAHTELTQAQPGNGAVLHQAPPALELSFTEAVQLLKLLVVDSHGAAVATGFKASATALQKFALPLPALPAGTFAVNWTVLGKDGHQVEGSLSFSIDPNAAESVGAAASSKHEGHH